MIKLEALIDEIDYDSLTEKITPIILEKSSDTVAGIASPIIKFVLKQLSDEKKEEIVVELLNNEKLNLGEKAEKALSDQNIKLKIKEIKAEKI